MLVTPLSGRRNFSLAFKQDVVNKAYPNDGTKSSIKAIARQFTIQPNQIRAWKKRFDEMEKKIIKCTNPLQKQKLIERITSPYITKFSNAGMSNKLPQTMIDHLHCFYLNKQELSETVSLKHLKMKFLLMNRI
jgi:Transposase